MLEIIENKEKKATTAILKGCALDAAKRVGKRLDIRNNEGEACICCIPHVEELIMTNKIVGTAKPLGDDKFDESVGKAKAIRKATKNHKSAFTKALKRWQVAMLRDIIAVSPETFEDALNTIYKK